ncbi:hypothetical protein [Pontibacter russatus]|uniref:hypothetical protein n=1 Tax=Pontibacter russatus TaxID=2694929 RepID=UPI00137B19C7|nr:hypothetical protein [Pontibacter russatus]
MKAREGEAAIYKEHPSFSFRFEAQRPGISFGRRLRDNLSSQSQSRFGNIQNISAGVVWKLCGSLYLCIPFRQGAVEVKGGG